MTDRELMQMALDALEEAQDYTSCPTYSPSMTQQCAVAAVALRARLALPEPAECDGGQCGIGGYCKQCPKTQLEQEPVAWMHNFIDDVIIKNRPTDITCNAGRWTALYTAPPQREWVGLTDEEIAEIAKIWLKGNRMLPFPLARAIEAKLKQKNSTTMRNIQTSDKND